MIPPKTKIGHVHLKVSDLKRSIEFYRDILGFKIMASMGDDAVFLSAGGYHHHIGLNTWHSKNGKQPDPSATGLYHFAILLPTRKDLARLLKTLMGKNYPIEGAADHGVSESIYISDPDGNGIEIYADKPKRQWKHNSKGNLIMVTEPLDLDSLLQELEQHKK